MRTLFLLAAASLFFQLTTPLSAQTRTVALTMDDLPFVAEGSGHSKPQAEQAAKANRKLLVAFARHHVPVTGFVIEKNIKGIASGTEILWAWTRHGLDLGNHTYEHLNFDEESVEQYEDQILRGEATFVPLMKAAGRKAEFFRFPYNHTGDTKEKHDTLAAFLTQHGYRLAPCTIENSDWMFNTAYALMLARHDLAAAAKLRTDYLAFTGAQIDYYIGLNKQVWGYEPPQIMLLHDNQLNADTIDELLALFEQRQFRWVSLAQAESDAAYQLPETAITSYGPMWGYRWARERGVKVDGILEPDPPKWVEEYGRKEPVKPRRPRSNF
jgi:peptidoglycan/xylan/chitin deacetylase (PgdA/CDA1 family)